MEFLGFALTVIGFGIAAAVWLRSVKLQRAATERAQELETRLARSNAAYKSAQDTADREIRRADELDEQVSGLSGTIRDLERSLAQAVARRDQKDIAKAMWALELERSYRNWRDVISPSKHARDGGVNQGQQLTYAISQEAERLREEVGVSIRFAGAIDRLVDEEFALGSLRVIEEVLSLASRRADEVDITVSERDDASDPELVFVARCVGWDDSHDGEYTEFVDIVENMVSRLDGSMATIHEPIDGRTIEVRVPAPAPAVSSSGVGSSVDAREVIDTRDETADAAAGGIAHAVAGETTIDASEPTTRA